MTANSKIEWTHHTFNPWWGCVKVSEGCKFCYANTLSSRYGHDVWGVDKPRRFFGDKHWTEPFKWDAQAEKNGERARVFCASMADVFEERDDLNEPRGRLWDLIEATNNLDWLLLTKRPENILRMLPQRWLESMPDNLWLGTSVETQKRAEERIPHLLNVPAKVRFLSVEPQLEKIHLELIDGCFYDGGMPFESQRLSHPANSDGRGIHWVIVGGESGAKARPFDARWAYSLRDECHNAGVAFFMKQLGGHPNKRDKLEDFPYDVRIREFPKE